jgi:curved DNA-binding protein CbpA
MFIDYYKILEIEINASPEEIRAAFRKQAIRWHPDKNPGNDTTIKMQVLNEAYLILKDPEARKLYDIEYIKFKKIKTKVEFKEDDESFNEEYVVSDDILRRWMDSAKKQSVDLAKQTIIDFRKMVIIGTKAAVKASGSQLLAQLFISLLIIVIMSLVGLCNRN